MDHKAGNQLPHGWMMGFSTVQVEQISCINRMRRTTTITLKPKIKHIGLVTTLGFTSSSTVLSVS